jgi:hypothetical protein
VDTTRLTVINNSSLSGIPDDLLDALTFMTLNRANDLLEGYNLRISEYDKIMDNGRLVEQKITLVDRQ